METRSKITPFGTFLGTTYWAEILFKDSNGLFLTKLATKIQNTGKI
jgi:hypothetical protein